LRVEQSVQRYLTLVWQILRRAGLGTADADDGCQDVFWVYAQRCDDIPDAATRSFLVTTALRVASDKRKSKWNSSVSHDLDESTVAERTVLPDEQLQLHRQLALLDEILSAMLPDERETFILSEIQEMTRTEVAQALGIPEGTVASRLRRAREHFERLLRTRRSGREARS
jgi:RNA polymerase sigma-70 factor (ECF subfamily)